MEVKTPTLLLLATFGLEMVECGGTLAKNVKAGGKSYTSVLLSRPVSRPQVMEAAKILGVTVSFLDFSYGYVTPDAESKKKLVKVIRQVKPDIIITQDTEHSFSDLDPDRRQAMILYLEAIALSSRDFALDEMPDLQPHPIPTIYYMVPEHPNCAVDISSVWNIKESAREKLEYQLAFSAKVLKERLSEETLKIIIPNIHSLQSDLEIGSSLYKETDKAFYLYHGLLSHGSKFALAEPYRREGYFNLDYLVP